MRRLAAFLGLSLVGYALVVRPRLLRWGATGDEVRAGFPGAEIIPGGTRSATMAVTIDAPPSAVWPWLVQMGYRRAGWYSWDLLDNFGRRSAGVLHPEWQAIAVGDFLAGPDARPLERKAWEVAAVDPQRFLGLRARPGKSSDSLWGFRLKQLPGDKTRLIVSGYWNMRPRWLQQVIGVTFLEWAHWFMQMKQFAEIKRRAERSWIHERPHSTTGYAGAAESAAAVEP